MRLLSWPLSAVWLLTLLALAGCEQEIVQEFQAAQTALAEGEEPAAGRFFADIAFCRKIGKKTGKRIGKGHAFSVAERSYVHGLVDFHQVELDRSHAIHLVWLRPDNHELYRRYAEVRVTREGDGYQTHIQWLRAEDLGYLNEAYLEVDTPTFTLKSRLNTSRSKERQPGRYTFKVYWNRELLLEDSFELASSLVSK